MHEMGIAMQIIEIAIDSIPVGLENAKVEKINLEIGKLAAVVPESLHFCFQVAAKETPLCNTTLDIEEIPVVIRCNDCRIEWTITEPVFRCRQCNSGSVEVISGRELDIRSIEIIHAEQSDADESV